MDELKLSSRNFAPKFSHYGSDGMGRDSYIYCNSGGLITVKSKPDIFFRKPQNDRPRKYVSPSPRYDGKPFKYYSDGSGRDFYVTHNSGGLHLQYTPGGKKDVFFNSLCNNDPIREADNFMRLTQGWVSPRNRNQLRKRSQVINECVTRLSPSRKPKFTSKNI